MNGILGELTRARADHSAFRGTRVNRITIKEAVTRISELPTLPVIVVRILELASDPDTSAINLSEVIATDQTLAARLLRLANSAYVAPVEPVTTLTQAVVILGFSEVRNLTLATRAFDAFPLGSSEYDREQLWRHSIATAMAAERISKTTKTSTEHAYIAGLVHDIGKVTLDALFPNAFRQAVKHARQEHKHLWEGERDALGIHHGEVGGVLAEHWNLPNTVRTAVHYHHEPHSYDGENELAHLAYLVSLADCMAYNTGFGDSSNEKAPTPSKDTYKLLGVTEQDVASIQEWLAGEEDRIDEIIGADV